MVSQFFQPKITLKRVKVFGSACLIFNPVSGQGNAQQDLEKIKSILDPYLQLDIRQTTKEIGAEQLAKEAVERQVELMIASGGDGTVSAVANAVIGTCIPFAIIPRGTANAFANGLGLPVTLEDACIAILQGAMMTVDTARCNEQPMLLLAGIGFEANTVKEADRQLKDTLGIFAYILAGLSQLQRLENFEARLETEDKTIIVQAAAITVANFAPPTSILAQGIGSNRADDGLLDVTIISPANAFEALSQAMELFESGLVHSNSENHHIGYLRVQKIHITTNPSQLITIDGEMSEANSAFFEILPQSLQVVSSYEQVITSQNKLAGLPNLTVVKNDEERIESLVVTGIISVNLSEIITKVGAEIGEALVLLWHTLTKGAKRIIQAVGESGNHSLWIITRKIDESLNELEKMTQSFISQPEMNHQTSTVNYEIKHSILGRIRLRIPRLSKDENYGKHLQSLIQSLKGVEAVKINHASSSLIVHYTPTLSEQSFEHLLINVIEQIS